MAGGRFNYRMGAKDGSSGFDFDGVYEKVILYKQIVYTIGDGRKLKIVFSAEDNTTEIVETFKDEQAHTIEMQQAGWQAILGNA